LAQEHGTALGKETSLPPRAEQTKALRWEHARKNTSSSGSNTSFNRISQPARIGLIGARRALSPATSQRHSDLILLPIKVSYGMFHKRHDAYQRDANQMSRHDFSKKTND
jgi:hypothetical protein